MSVWFGVKFTPGGHSTFFGLLNTFVHIIMYAYYLLAALGPQVQKYLWWKKYLTFIQMVSFSCHSYRLFKFFTFSFLKKWGNILPMKNIWFSYNFYKKPSFSSLFKDISFYRPLPFRPRSMSYSICTFLVLTHASLSGHC